MRRAFLVLVALFPGACSPSPATPRSLVLVTADALRADRVKKTSTHGLDHLDAFMDESLVFERCLSSSPSTAGAIGSLMTGNYAHAIGSPSPVRPLLVGEGRGGASRVGAATLAETLAGNGWQTAAFVSTRALGSHLGWARGFALYAEPEEGQATRDDYDVARAARLWLLHERDPGRPFFLWVHLSGGHGPYALERDQAYDALRPFRRALQAAETDAGANRTLSLLQDNTGRGGIPLYQQVGTRGGGQSEAKHVLNHDLRVLRTCFLVGELRHVLKRAGLYSNTALVFHGTHGEALGEHGVFFQHGEQLFREDLAVPLLIRVPGSGSERVAPTGEVVSTLDLLPTLLALLDVPAPVDLPGADLLGSSGALRGWAFSESYPPGASTRRLALTGTRWKAMQPEGGALRLYDLERDPEERSPLSAPYPTEARGTLDALRALLDAVEGTLLDADLDRSMTDAEVQLWRGLGYEF